MHSRIVLLSLITAQLCVALTSADISELVSADRSAWHQISAPYIPPQQLREDFGSQSLLSREELFLARNVLPSKHSVDAVLSAAAREDIELVISEDDAEATRDLVDGFARLLSESVEVREPERLRRLFIAMGAPTDFDGFRFNASSSHSESESESESVGFNGYESISRILDQRSSSLTGKRGEFVHFRNGGRRCAQRANCNVFPAFRVLLRSRSQSVVDGSNSALSFSCADIFDQFLPQIFECVEQFGAEFRERCPFYVGGGYFREVFRVRIPNSSPPRFVALKMQRPSKTDDAARDLQRHIRESIFLQRLQSAEEAFLDKFGAVWHSREENGSARAFPFVRELGHCAWPFWISVSPLFPDSLERFIKRGDAAKLSLRALVGMAFEMARGVEAVHGVVGGPMHHTDVGIDQFVLDADGRVLLNDFNRAKLQTFDFEFDSDGEGTETTSTAQCRYCGYAGDGRSRAPEELSVTAMDARVDVYSLAMAIWSLFAGTRPWTHRDAYAESDDFSSESEVIDADDVRYLVLETARRPSMPYSMPFALQQTLWSAMAQNAQSRPSAAEFRRSIEFVYRNIDRLTRGRADVRADEAMKQRMFRQRTHPKVPEGFPECCVDKYL